MVTSELEFTTCLDAYEKITFAPTPAIAVSTGNLLGVLKVPVLLVLWPTEDTFSFATNPGSYLSTNSGVVDTNSGGSNAYMYVYGSNWASGSSSFGVSNTLWSAITQASYTGTQLSATSSNTAMLVPSSGSNTIYFGVAVPASQPSGSYTQNIIIENSC